MKKEIIDIIINFYLKWKHWIFFFGGIYGGFALATQWQQKDWHLLIDVWAIIIVLAAEVWFLSLIIILLPEHIKGWKLQRNRKRIENKLLEELVKIQTS